MDNCSNFNDKDDIDQIVIKVFAISITASPNPFCESGNVTLIFNLTDTGNIYDVVYRDGTTEHTVTDLEDGDTDVWNISETITYSIVSITIHDTGCPIRSNLENAKVTVTVSSPQTPTFTELEAKCEGGSNPLPEESTNGLTGIWNQTDNADGSFTYTFVLDAGQGCYIGTSFKVNITEVVHAIFDKTEYVFCPEVGFTLPSPTNHVQGTWDRTFVGEGDYTFTPDLACGIPTTIYVKATDQFEPIFNIKTTYCQGDEIFKLPTVSENGIVGTWSNSFIETFDVGSKSYVFTPDERQCAVPITLNVIVKNCDEYEDIRIPNFISPNGDGFNEVWRIQGLSQYNDIRISIYDRYNKLIFECNDSHNCVWNGKYLGRPLPTGDYWYILEHKNKLIKKGHITLRNR